MDEWLYYQTITKWKVNVETGRVIHENGFTRPIKGTAKAPKKQVVTKSFDTGEIEEEVIL